MIGSPHPALLAERAQRLADLVQRPPWYRPILRRRWDRVRAAITAMDVSMFAYMLREAYAASTVVEMAKRDSPMSMISKEKR